MLATRLPLSHSLGIDLQYPDAIDRLKVGDYPAMTKSGGGYFFDQVLEYRVWCHPERGAPDEADGDDYYYAFETRDEAVAFSDATDGVEVPLVLIRQFEWVNEPTPGVYIHERGERITEWQVEWLLDGPRTPGAIEELIASKHGAEGR